MAGLGVVNRPLTKEANTECREEPKEVTMFNSGSTHHGRSLAGAFALITFIMCPYPAEPHEAPTGWRYPYACCSDRDCRTVSDAAVTEGPEGYVIKVTGEVLPYTDRRVRNSPDGVFHWCSMAGQENSRTICLFVPPRAF